MSIPASAIVNIVPRVIGGGGAGLELNGLFLSSNASIPTGAVTSWASADDVAVYFGATSDEAELAVQYFNGFVNSDIKPKTLYIARWNETAVAAWARGGAIALTLAQLKAITDGAFKITVDSTLYSLSSLSFSACTSFSDCAVVIQAALRAAGATLATVTYSSTFGAFEITSGTTGANSTITYGSAPTSGTDLSVSLKLTAALGALLSQGKAAQTPVEIMQGVVNITTNWVTFMTVFEPSLDDKLLLAAWCSGKGTRYAYIAWGEEVAALTADNAACFAQEVATANYAGTASIYGGSDLAAFVCGSIASIDYNARNGRITLAFKQGSGLTANVTNETVAAALLGNGYNFYGDYATANDQFTWFYNGQISGDASWIDTYVNQVWLNNALQLAIMNLFSLAKALPYNAKGYNRVRAACADPINAGLNAGVIVPNVSLSSVQADEVNAEAGLTIAPSLSRDGWYLQILDATAQNRAQRLTPPAKFWYMDGGSIQRFEMSSTVVL